MSSLATLPKCPQMNLRWKTSSNTDTVGCSWISGSYEQANTTAYWYFPREIQVRNGRTYIPSGVVVREGCKLCSIRVMSSGVHTDEWLTVESAVLKRLVIQREAYISCPGVSSKIEQYMPQQVRRVVHFRELSACPVQYSYHELRLGKAWSRGVCCYHLRNMKVSTSLQSLQSTY